MAESHSSSELPPALREIVDFFAPLPEPDRREALLAYASQADQHAPRADEDYAVSEERHDEEDCLDSVGIFLLRHGDDTVTFRVTLGPDVQTLTRALAVILCRGLEGGSLSRIVTLCDNFVPTIVGAPLMRLRSRTVYYVLRRMREAARQCR